MQDEYCAKFVHDLIGRDVPEDIALPRTWTGYECFSCAASRAEAVGLSPTVADIDESIADVYNTLIALHSRGGINNLKEVDITAEPRSFKAISAASTTASKHKRNFFFLSEVEVGHWSEVSGIKIAIERYRIKTKQLEASVKTKIAAAKAVAAEAERGKVGLEEIRAELETKKTEVRRAETAAEIAMQNYIVAAVQVEILKAQADVLRANVKAARALMEGQEAVAEAMATTAEAGLTRVGASMAIADAAMYNAEASSKAVAAIRFAGESAELAAEAAIGPGRFGAQATIAEAQANSAVTATSAIEAANQLIASLGGVRAEGEQIRMGEQYEVPRAGLEADISAGTSDAANHAAHQMAMAQTQLVKFYARLSQELGSTTAHSLVKSLIAEAQASIKSAEAHQKLVMVINQDQKIDSEQEKTSFESIGGGTQ